MIITVILYLLYGIVYALSSPLRLFDDVSAALWIFSTISQVSGYLSTAYQWLPATVIAIGVTWGLYGTVEFGINVYKGIMWLVRKIPGIS